MLAKSSPNIIGGFVYSQDKCVFPCSYIPLKWFDEINAFSLFLKYYKLVTVRITSKAWTVIFFPVTLHAIYLINISTRSMEVTSLVYNPAKRQRQMCKRYCEKHLNAKLRSKQSSFLSSDVQRN